MRLPVGFNVCHYLQPIHKDVNMKNLSSVILFLLIASSVITLSGCDSAPVNRQEVIERFTGGEKRIVVTYVGSGANEKLILRQTFDADGDLVLLEDIEHGSIINWLELHPELKTSEGLKVYFQGEWVYEKKSKYSKEISKTIFQIEENTSTQTYTDGGVNVWKFKFNDDFLLEMIVPDEEKTIIFKVEPVSKSLLYLGSTMSGASSERLTLSRLK